jgi:hypothetical protein
MKNTLIVDVHNWFTTGQKRFPNHLVDFAAIGELLPFHRKIAYGRQSEDKGGEFSKHLQELGYEVRFGSAPYNVELALTVAEMIERRAVDRLVLGTSNFEAVHILEYAFNRGIEVTPVGFGVPAAFGKYGETIELDINVLKEIPNDVPTNGLVEVVAEPF